MNPGGRDLLQWILMEYGKAGVVAMAAQIYEAPQATKRDCLL
jgi:hypothetical protein